MTQTGDTQTGNNDSITIQNINEATQLMAVTLNIGGAPYQQNVPLLNVEDPALLSAQLAVYAQQTRTAIQALTAAVEAADANKLPTVSAAVTALVGQSIPVDAAPAPAAPTP